MAMLPIDRPRLALSLSEDALRLLEMRRRWGGRRVKWCVHRWQEAPLEPGLLRRAMLTGDHKDSEALIEAIHNVAGDHGLSMGRRPCIALVMPDLSARLTLLEFESWPPKLAERDALVRFRCHQEMNGATSDADVLWRAFLRETDTTSSVRVLAALIPRHIKTQYERLCERLRCVPVTQGLSSLLTFNACRHAMEILLGGRRDFFFVHAPSATLSCFAFHDGILTFVRVKPLPRADPDVLRHEIIATVQCHDERTAVMRDRTARRPLFTVGVKTLDVPDAVGVDPMALSWDALNGCSLFGRATPPLGFLPAAAALLQGA